LNNRIEENEYSVVFLPIVDSYSMRYARVGEAGYYWDTPGTMGHRYSFFFCFSV